MAEPFFVASKWICFVAHCEFIIQKLESVLDIQRVATWPETLLAFVFGFCGQPDQGDVFAAVDRNV